MQQCSSHAPVKQQATLAGPKLIPAAAKRGSLQQQADRLLLKGQARVVQRHGAKARGQRGVGAMLHQYARELQLQPEARRNRSAGRRAGMRLCTGLPN